MAITELPTSRRITYGSGQPIGVREYHVYPYPTEADVLNLFASGLLPGKLEKWPSAGYFTPDVDLRVFDYEILRDPEVQEAWIVRITYREQGPDALTPNLTPNEAGYISMRTSMEAQFEDAWRQWNSVDELSNINISKLDDFFRPLFPIGSLDGDIGGTRIDVAGNPTSVMKHVQRIQLELVSPFRPSANVYRSYLGTRNLSTFLDCPRGTVVFAGVEGAISSPGKWSLTFNFDVDFWYHLKQVPKRHPNGSVILDVGTEGTDGTGHAKIVSWVQPFPIGTEFRNMTSFFASLP
jgi:hypothetical protein